MLIVPSEKTQAVVSMATERGEREKEKRRGCLSSADRKRREDDSIAWNVNGQDYY